MIRRTTSFALIVAASIGLAGCAATTPASSGADEEGVDDVSTPPPVETTIEDFDFGTTDWRFSSGGSDLPIDVSLVDGASTVDVFQYEVGDPVFGDADSDGRTDAIVPISRLDGNGSDTVWYLWYDSGDDDGVGIRQIEFPIAQQSRCGRFVESVTAADGGFVVHEFLRLTGTDDTVPCSEPGTGELTRTVALHRSEDGTLWPVQTSPIPAYGGICPGSPWLDGPGEQLTLLSAPVDGAPVATSADQQVGVFELYQSHITAIDGWGLVGFVQGEVDTGAVRLFCGWQKL
ncbi:hypothetical protein IWX78_001140 [Mycetocola sp. CAN_C7]|uniref:hypothetical protein n=1 Tax=Mycetocola sp. CAN_C7 TaxID=2787724 RepID=UPI0018C90EDC